jgi:hypothetical protein
MGRTKLEFTKEENEKYAKMKKFEVKYNLVFL